MSIKIEVTDSLLQHLQKEYWEVPPNGNVRHVCPEPGHFTCVTCVCARPLQKCHPVGRRHRVHLTWSNVYCASGVGRSGQKLYGQDRLSLVSVSGPVITGENRWGEEGIILNPSGFWSEWSWLNGRKSNRGANQLRPPSSPPLTEDGRKGGPKIPPPVTHVMDTHTPSLLRIVVDQMTFYRTKGFRTCCGSRDPTARNLTKEGGKHWSVLSEFVLVFRQLFFFCLVSSINFHTRLLNKWI